MTTQVRGVSPPESFTFSRPEEWHKWSRRFERYRQVSGLLDQSEGQVNIYSMRDEVEDIFHLFGLSDANRKKYDIVKKRFDDHFIPTHDTIFERARFNHRVQEEGESVDAFITDFYTLAEHCNYKDLRDDLIRDRIVVGITDS